MDQSEEKRTPDPKRVFEAIARIIGERNDVKITVKAVKEREKEKTA